MTTNHKNVRVRFAPSPTGMLHIGGLRTALFNFLFARHNNGAFLLRIEDTDKDRSQARYTDAILDTMAWCSMQPDEPIIIQSERHEEHIKIARKLVDEQKAYYCYCTPEDVQSRVTQVTVDGVIHSHYDGFCKQFIGQYHEKPHVIRFAVPSDRTSIVIDDIIKGQIVFDAHVLDDFILVRSDGTPMYNFVVVVDDAFMKISHIIRGEEHLINTPKQLLLYEACGYDIPLFGHLPLILGPDGTKMSKREAAANAYDYKARGYLPDALCNYLVRLGWSHGDQEIFSFQEMVSYFSLDAITSKGALFDTQKLDWVNSMHMKALSAPVLYTYIKHVMHVALDNHCHNWSLQTIYALIDQYKKRCTTLRDMCEVLMLLHQKPTRYEHASLSADEKKIIGNLISSLAIIDFTHDVLSQNLKDFCKTQDISLGVVGPLIRIALTGVKDAPGIYDLMCALGKQETLSRLNHYYAC